MRHRRWIARRSKYVIGIVIENLCRISHVIDARTETRRKTGISKRLYFIDDVKHAVFASGINQWNQCKWIIGGKWLSTLVLVVPSIINMQWIEWIRCLL